MDFTGDTLDSDPLAWVWKTEMETHRQLLQMARGQLQQLGSILQNSIWA
jgi:hypothetical protein